MHPGWHVCDPGRGAPRRRRLIHPDQSGGDLCDPDPGGAPK